MGTYVGGFGCALEVWFDGFILFVELGEVRDEVFDDVGVWERVYTAFLCGVCWDAACGY